MDCGAGWATGVWLVSGGFWIMTAREILAKHNLTKPIGVSESFTPSEMVGSLIGTLLALAVGQLALVESKTSASQDTVADVP